MWQLASVPRPKRRRRPKPWTGPTLLSSQDVIGSLDPEHVAANWRNGPSIGPFKFPENDLAWLQRRAPRATWSAALRELIERARGLAPARTAWWPVRGSIGIAFTHAPGAHDASMGIVGIDHQGARPRVVSWRVETRARAATCARLMDVAMDLVASADGYVPVDLAAVLAPQLLFRQDPHRQDKRQEGDASWQLAMRWGAVFGALQAHGLAPLEVSMVSVRDKLGPEAGEVAPVLADGALDVPPEARAPVWLAIATVAAAIEVEAARVRDEQSRPTWEVRRDGRDRRENPDAGTASDAPREPQENPEKGLDTG